MDEKTEAQAANATPVAWTSTVTAVDGKNALQTTAGRRIQLMLALGLLGYAIAAISHGMHTLGEGRCRGDGKVGHWGNATAEDLASLAQRPVVPCAVDLEQLLASANVHIDVDPTMLRQQHGCCGDNVCSLGEDSSNCATDCTNGMAGTLVWIDPDDGHHGRRGRRGRGDHDDDDDDDRDDDHDHDRDRDGHRHDDDYSHADKKDDHHGRSKSHGDKHGKKHNKRHALVLFVVGAILLIASGILGLSIRKDIGAIMVDFKTFFWPGCSGCARKSAAQTDQLP